jgi:D-xylose reductase
MGYRHFDCACDYGNEREVGDGLRKALSGGLCRRDDLWITSKLWNTFHAPEHVRPALERSLSDLGLDYLDLYLVHFPIALKYVAPERRYPPGWLHDPRANAPRMEPAAVPLQETWQAMEALVEQGLVRNIGICNYSSGLLRDLLNYATIRPAVLQVESHPLLTQEKLLRFCRQESIAFTAFSPIGALSYQPLGMAGDEESVLERPIVREIAAAHGKSPAQVVLRWGVQRGTVVIPKSSDPGHLRENLSLYDFELSVDQMQQISGLDEHRRFNDPGVFCEAAFNTFFPIFD